MDSSGDFYPCEFVGQMETRYEKVYEVIAVFNADFAGSPQHNHYEHGPEGLTVKNGERFDGWKMGDCDTVCPTPTPGATPPWCESNDVNRPSLAISRFGKIDISYKDMEDLDNPASYDDRFYNAVGGRPLLVKNGVSVVATECTIESPCSDVDRGKKRGRTAVGKTADDETAGGKLIVLVTSDVEPEPDTRKTLDELADMMIQLGAVEAMNLDGGGSTQLRYNGDYLVESSDGRKVVEGLLIYIHPSISGRVTDDQGKPISAVTISASSDTNATTDSDGDYTISGLPAGTYTIKPSKSGYSFSPPSTEVYVPPSVTGQDFIGKIECPVIVALTSANSNVQHLGLFKRVQAAGAIASSNVRAYSSSYGSLLDREDLVSLYHRLRDEVLSPSSVGQSYIKDFDVHGPELSTILLLDSDLRTRTAQFLEHAAPAFDSLLPDATEDVVLTLSLYDEADGLVQDLANAGSPEFRDEMLQTWEDMALDEHIDETATEIWEQMQQSATYLPIILKSY